MRSREVKRFGESRERMRITARFLVVESGSIKAISLTIYTV